jgi:glycerate 2-kinase
MTDDGAVRSPAARDILPRVPNVPGIPAGVLVAPDSFKGTLRAAEVTAALGAGIEAAGVAVDPCPVADCGEGALEVLAAPLGARLETVTVSDPLGRPVEAAFGLTEGRRGGPAAAILDMAAASGLGLVAPSERDAVQASTFGTGELIVAAVRAGAGLVYVGVGGSATSDGGAGAIKAIREAGGVGAARLVVLCDVRTPFEDAARVYGPQKGAGPQDVLRLTSRLHALARRLDRDPRGLPMTGAAGGLAGGLWAACGAEMVPGAGFVLDAIEFDRRMRSARAVVTGEGKLDQQSLAGKAVSEVATRARQAGVPCFAVCGQRELDSFGARVLDLQAVLEASTTAELERAGRELVKLMWS